jgi:hypothetical protein
MKNLENEIDKLVCNYKLKMKNRMKIKQNELVECIDPLNDYRLLPQILGSTLDEIQDMVLKTQRFTFVSIYAGHLIEDAVAACFIKKHPSLERDHKIEYIDEDGKRRSYKVDIFFDNTIIEVKNRAASNDSPVRKREKDKVKLFREMNYNTVNLIFNLPRDKQTISSINSLGEEIKKMGGIFLVGLDAWNYVKNETGYDLKNIFENIKNEGGINFSQNSPESSVRKEQSYIPLDRFFNLLT